MLSIILHKRNRGEADELVVFFSRDLGWMTGVAKNARRSRVRFGGHLEPISLVDLTLRSRRRDDLVWIDESQLVRGFLGIRSDIARLSKAAYLLELASIFLPESHPDALVFDFVFDFLTALDQSDLSPVRFMLDEIRLLGLLGYAPRFDACAECGKPLEPTHDALFSPQRGGACHPGCVGPGEDRTLFLSPDTLALVRRGLQVKSDKADRLKLNRKGREELRRALSAFVRHWRGEDIKSLTFLETVVCVV